MNLNYSITNNYVVFVYFNCWGIIVFYQWAIANKNKIPKIILSPNL